MEVTLINERGEVVPVIVEEDGTVSLLTLAEVEAMREQGKIQPAQKEMLTPLEPLLLTAEEQMVLDIIMEQLAE